MTHKCLIIDDEDLARELIESHLSQLPGFELVASCASAIEARKILQNEQIDLLFLDIEMPVLKGTDFFRNLLHQPSVIFTTAYRDYALDGFELNAVDYLLKPITFQRFFKATEKFLNQQQTIIAPTPTSSFNTKDAFVFIRKDRKQVKVFLKEILYIESLKDYIKIYQSMEEFHTIKHSITAFQKLLDERFLRIHRSFVINVDKITAYTKHDVEIGAVEIPIGESYRKVVELYFKN